MNTDIRIGTMVSAGQRSPDYITKILPHGFESFQLSFWQNVDADLPQLADGVAKVLDGSGAVISSLGIYGNPLGTTETDAATRRGWLACIENAARFGCDLVCGFAGRVPGVPVPDSIPRFGEVFGSLADRAGELGVRLAFENCPMGGSWSAGDWNIAFHPRAWDLMFERLPHPHIGLEWEPCHQLCQLIDPLPQLREWLPRVFHIHGKDAKVLHDVVRTRGVLGAEEFAFHKHPGLGDTNWTRLIEDLRKGGFRGAIDIEGWHDDVYKGPLEMTGQVNALRHLKACRLEFVPNPEGF